MSACTFIEVSQMDTHTILPLVHKTDNSVSWNWYLWVTLQKVSLIVSLVLRNIAIAKLRNRNCCDCETLQRTSIAKLRNEFIATRQEPQLLPIRLPYFSTYYFSYLHQNELQAILIHELIKKNGFLSGLMKSFFQLMFQCTYVHQKV